MLYLGIMLYVVLGMLREVRPAGERDDYRCSSAYAAFYLLAGVLFAAGQVIFFLASQPLCDVSGDQRHRADTRLRTNE